MSDFLRDLEKANPAPKEESKTDPKEIVNNSASLTTEDMKTYFNAMRESLMQDFKKEMQEMLKSADPQKDIEHTEQEKEEKEEV